MLISRGHRASRTRRSAVQTHTRRADWLKSSTSVSDAEGGGHRASRTGGSAVKAHAYCADWLGMAADEQHQREQ